MLPKRDAKKIVRNSQENIAIKNLAVYFHVFMRNKTCTIINPWKYVIYII
ncbi:hypothetical protein SCIP_0089 [Scardovia inopinata JCM 12537]|nr:hypothetical protein SCIP_0089 [Scardovia inopinata JCM 12537]